MMVKICGITNSEDALAAAQGGASALGFIFCPKSPRCVVPEQAARIIETLPAGVWKVGVFVNEKPTVVSATAEAVGLDVVQLHGEETAADFPSGLRVWKAIRVGASVPDLNAYPCEAILLDGTASGRAFNWDLARIPGRRIIIAGGLGPENVRVAVSRAYPWGVDACSSLESEPGRKDHARMVAFLRSLRT